MNGDERFIPELKIEFHGNDEYGNQRYFFVIRWQSKKHMIPIVVDDFIDIGKPNLSDVEDFWKRQIIYDPSRVEEEIIEDKIEELIKSMNAVKENLWICMTEKMKTAFNRFYQYKEESGDTELVLNIEYSSSDELIEVPWELMRAADDTDNCLTEEYMLCKTFRATKDDTKFEKREKGLLPINVLIITNLSLEPWIHIKERPVLNKILTDIEQSFESYVKFLILDRENIVEVKHKHGKDLDYAKIIKLIMNEHDTTFDLILIVGSCFSGTSKGKYKIPIGSLIIDIEKNKYIERKFWKTKKGNPVFFLDGCYSARTPLEKPSENICFGGSHKTLNDLLGGSSKNVVFIGSLFPIDPMFALSFTINFLRLLFEHDRSLTGSVWAATKNSVVELERLMNKYDDKKKYEEFFELEKKLFEKSYVICAKNAELACDAPAFIRKPTPRIYWSEVSFDYFGEIATEIFRTIGVRNIQIPLVAKSFDEIEKEIKDSEHLIISEFPIIRFINKLCDTEEEKGDFVIIGTLFTPKKDDCTLIMTGKRLEELKGGILFNPGIDKSVTTFLRIMLKYNKINEKEIYFIPSMSYKDIEEDFIKYIINKTKTPPIGWLQITGRMFAAKIISEQHKQDLPSPVSAFNIRSQATKRIIKKYPNVFKKQDEFRLPGTLLVCRKQFVKNNAERIYEIMETLRNRFIEKLSGKNFEYRDYRRDFNLDIPKKDVKIEDYHNLKETIFLSKKGIRSLIYFSKYLKKELENENIVKRELSINDFLPILPLPSDWRGILLKDIKDNLYEIGEDIVRILREYIENLRKYIKRKNYFDEIAKKIDKIDSINKEIKEEAGSKHEVNSLKFMVMYGIEEIINDIDTILSKEDNFKVINKKISTSDFKQAVMCEMKKMDSTLANVPIRIKNDEKFFHEYRDKIIEIANKFKTHPEKPDEDKIKNWLSLFDTNYDMKLALKLLDNVHYYYYDAKAIRETFKELNNELKEKLGEKYHNAYFLGIGEPGKSGPSLLYFYPHPDGANKELSMIIAEPGLENKILVFVDDFIGSGSQVKDFYNVGIPTRVHTLLESFLKSGKIEKMDSIIHAITERIKNMEAYYLSIVGFMDGIKTIEENTNFKVLVGRRLKNCDKAFSEDCKIFGRKEERVYAEHMVRKCGLFLYPRGPLGYSNSQALVVFSYNTPSNTLPILWAPIAGTEKKYKDKDWTSLFPRYEKKFLS